jgi:GLPGLI family protein
MKPFFLFLILTMVLPLNEFTPLQTKIEGKATYYTKTKMELGSWGARMSEAQKKQVQERLKNRLEKTYHLTFNRYESLFVEEDKIDALSGATDSWGSNFSRGHQYKNLKDSTLVQSQEFYGKRFLVKDQLLPFQWILQSETKQIGNYLCFKAVTTVPTRTLNWFDFSWNDLSDKPADEISMTPVEAWYTLQIPLNHGPAEFWGLPGFILEVSAGNTTMLCSEIILNPKEPIAINPPDKGEPISIENYRGTVKDKMSEMRNSYGRRRN